MSSLSAFVRCRLAGKQANKMVNSLAQLNLSSDVAGAMALDVGGGGVLNEIEWQKSNRIDRYAFTARQLCVHSRDL